jgi:hypothetical protein
MVRVVPIGACITLGLLTGCGSPDLPALKKLACEKAVNTIDLQSVAQLDALRKALGLAPDVDPIAECRALGVIAEPKPPSDSQGTGDNNEAGEKEN